MKNTNNNKIKILIVGMTSGVGGVESFVCNLNDFIDHSKFQIDFLVHQNINSKYEESIRKNDSKIYMIKGIKSGIFKYFKSLFNFYKNHKYSIVHLNECSALYFIYVLPLIFERKTKLIVHSHNGNSENKILHKIISFFQNKRADATLACSDVASEWMFGKIQKDEAVIVHNGIDLDKFRYNESIRLKTRESLHINDKIVFGSIARFCLQKNHTKIISIFEQYYKKNNNAVLVLVGDGEEKSKINQIVQEKKLENCVVFLGLRNDIPNLLNCFDIFLLPSLFEGLPFVAIEAQACALPIIASDTISKEVKLTNLVYFEKIESSDEKWEERIEEILNMNINRKNNEYQKQLRNQGYDIKNVCETIEQEYCKILDK